MTRSRSFDNDSIDRTLASLLIGVMILGFIVLSMSGLRYISTHAGSAPSTEQASERTPQPELGSQ